MNNGTAVELRPVATPGRIGQATAVEQSRAVAEVQAAVIVAQQCPRSVPLAIAAMEEACAQIELAARAFFSYPRAGETVNGPSVHLARELARTWGNIQHGITELARDDNRGESEMQAWAWDVQTNTRSSNTFIVPHKRDTKKGVKDLTDMRDIYENNANNGARRLREAIFSVLPAWYSARAQTLCQATIENGGGRPLAQRIADAVKAFERYRVSPARMAAKFGHAGVDDLTASDVAQLGVIYDSLKQGTVTIDDEFPAEAAGLIGPADFAPQNVPPAPVVTAPDAGAEPLGAESAGGTRTYDELLTFISERLGQLDVPDAADKLRAVSLIAGVSVKSAKGLKYEEAVKVADTLDAIDGPGPDGLLADLERKARGEGGSDGSE